ncbi:MAG: hypothetical protein P8Z35_08120 [Ignavibacteriaceae bacterium]
MKVKYFLLILFLMSFYFKTYAQYEMSLRNDHLISGTQYEFDVYIKSTSGKINLTSYQIVLSFNESIKNNGNLTFEYISGSSQLTNAPDANVGVVSDIQNDNLAAASGPGSDTISTTAVKVGTFRITGSNSFSITTPNVGWKFGGNIRTETDINDSNKTKASNYYNILHNYILPVELTSFSGSVNNFAVDLNWTTKTELNNHGFQIERATDDRKFVKVGFVEGNGTTTEPHSYSFRDKNITVGTKFLYRLKQIDNNGQFEYSKEIEITLVPKQYTLYQNYPNPFNPSTK